MEYFAGSVMDGVAEFFGSGKALRHPSEEPIVSLPDDLFAHSDSQTEWWYYTGHCETESGRSFGFEFVFFKRRTDLDRIGIFPVSLVANPMYAAHFAITDLEKGTFDYDHKRSFGNPFDIPVFASEAAYDLRLGDWTFREVAGSHILHATLGDGLTFDAVIKAEKPVVLNGDAGINRKMTGASNHFSFTRMEVAGRIVNNGLSEKFTGSAWMDREYGTWEQKYWDWFSIQFDDETELMIYQYRDEDNIANDDSTGTFVDKDGVCTYLTLDDYNIEPLEYWTSPKTGTEYPSRWRIEVAKLGIDIIVEPVLADQELDTRGTTMIVYWEGACQVSGSRSGKELTGRAYVELVGYERSHENMSLTTFLFSDPVRRLRSLF